MNTKSPYKQLFNKNNLSDKTIHIKSFQQPMLVAAIETDELLKLILQLFYNIGYQVHLVEFKKVLVNKKIATRGIIDKKIELLELIGAIEIKDYYAKMTAQGISYFKDEYYKPNISVLDKSSLKQLTQAKGSIVTKKTRISKAFKDVYNSDKFTYAIITNSKDTKNKYINKLEKTIEHIKDNLYFDVAKRMNKYKKYNISIPIVIHIDRNVFKKYPDELLEIKENQKITYGHREDLADAVAHLNIKYRAYNP